ncbi:hypothetical protein C8A01DRAFT_41369 [Parachaetomium inaequale]|uniref:Uncharacterized protein n=1 Tax=Parachaetomium inaequale TaxID=2588326 RepID=A0AAN6SKW9_9PEZI|nr:hypothetical protein C8A01DRAFT_41369 [Parachaetomium inaequale]
MDNNNNNNNNITDKTAPLAAALDPLATGSAPPGALAMSGPVPRPTIRALAPEILFRVAQHLGNGSLLAFSLTSRHGHGLLQYSLLTRGEDIVEATATVPSQPLPRTTLITTTLGGTLVPRDDAIRTDFFGRVANPPQPLTNIHRALHHGLRRRLPQYIDGVLALAPRDFVMREMFVEDFVTLAAERRDVQFEEFLLVRFGEGALREALASGRMLLDVVARAAGGVREGGCFGPAIMLLLKYVRREVRGPRRGFVLVGGRAPRVVEQEEGQEGGDGAAAAAVEGPERADVDIEKDLLETMMGLGKTGCVVHDGMSGDSCFVAMMELAARKGMLDFTDVNRAKLERWIGKLPEDVRVRIWYLLASAVGSPLPRP